MNPCKDCVVDMVCIQKCPIFEIDLDRLQNDVLIYTKRCMNNIKRKTYEISNGVIIEIRNERIYWFKDGELHRDNDQPAIIFFDGTRCWYKNGQLHRDNDQPAAIYYTGSRYWYKNGNRHRDNDKPAVISVDGERYWYKDGVEYEPI